MPAHRYRGRGGGRGGAARGRVRPQMIRIDNASILFYINSDNNARGDVGHQNPRDYENFEGVQFEPVHQEPPRLQDPSQGEPGEVGDVVGPEDPEVVIVKVVEPVEPVAEHVVAEPSRPLPADCQNLNRKQAKKIFNTTEMREWKRIREVKRRQEAEEARIREAVARGGGGDEW